MNSTSLRRAANLAIVIFLAGLWMVTLRPTSLGGPTGYIMVAGISMKPTLQPGDLTLMRHQRSYRIGDVVAYRIPKGQTGAGVPIIHRIVGVSESGFITKGDNNNAPDDWHPTSYDVIGKLWIHIPSAAKVLLAIRTPLALASLAAGAAIAFVVTGGDRKRKQVAEPDPLAWRDDVRDKQLGPAELFPPHVQSRLRSFENDDEPRAASTERYFGFDEDTGVATDRVCAACGSRVPREQSRFCPNCGAALKAPSSNGSVVAEEEARFSELVDQVARLLDRPALPAPAPTNGAVRLPQSLADSNR